MKRIKLALRRVSHSLALASALANLTSSVFAQSVTGQVTGTVVDSTGGAIAGASVQLTHTDSQQTRSFTTGTAGSFIFTGLVPGTYSLRVTSSGFKAYEQKSLTVSTQERVDLHEVALSVGDVASTVEVLASAVHVATDSSDRSISIGLHQIQDTPTRGRNPVSLIMTLPGVQTLASNDYRGWSGGGIPAVNGGQTGQVILNIDGVSSQDSGNLNPGYLSPSLDSIGEVKLLVSNYAAEYGGRTGGQLTFTTKSGTPQFHGTAYYYWRHEMFNANEFINNKTGVQKPKYRYQNPGGTIGGPLFIPGVGFNRNRTKLFFFFSYDKLLNANTIDNSYTMPSALERMGDFSQTVTTTGALIPIIDPNTGQQFPGNIIPQSRISPAGQAMLNLFPLPDARGLALDPTGKRAYNYRVVLPQSRPLDDKVLRLDYNISPRLTSYVRLLQDYQAVDGFAGTVGPSGGAWGQFPHSYHVQAAGVAATLVFVATPSIVNEFTYGINRGKQGVNPLDGPISPNAGGTHTYADNLLPLKDVNGKPIALPRIFKDSNILNLLPQVNFGFPAAFSAQSAGQTINQAPTFGHDSRWPFTGTDSLHTISDKVTWVKGSHTVKAGLYLERMARNVSVYSVYNTAGTYYFGSDRAAALDTNYPYSNALIGSIFAYGDDNKKQINHARYLQAEWFVQDTWKARKNLTFDYGLRFYRVGDLYSEGGTLGLFNASEYDPKKAGQLLYPALLNGQKIAINPVTGATFPFVRQGSFDTASYPAGGIPFSGIHQYDSHFFNVPPIQLGPRVGFAWDIFGDGKTALRGGYGITVGRNWTVDNIGATGAGQGPLAAPPNFLAPTILYTSFSDLANAQPYFTPQNVLGGSQDQKVQTTYNWSLGIQRDISRGMVLDVSYVGNALRHGYGQYFDYNAVPLYTEWTPSGGNVAKYKDPTSSGFYSTNLVRALVGYQGFGQIPIWTYGGTDNYNALQVQLNRRVGRLQWNANYTYSRTIIYTNYQFVDSKLGKNVTNRPHAVNFNFGYDIPGLSRFWSNGVTKTVFDGWHLNGNGAIYSGTPFGITCQAQSAPAGYWTGTPNAGGNYLPFRCQMGDQIYLPDGKYPSATEDPRLQIPLNPANFTLPGINSLGIGNTPPTIAYGPGAFNLDLSLAKTFRLTERVGLELRAETFNTLNHFNPNNPNTTLTYNFNTGAQTNAAFGTINGAQVQARRAAMSLRLRF